MDKTALRALSYGVYIVSTLDGERFVGCVANSAMQVTSRPATVAVSINHDNYTNKCIQSTGSFALSVLSEQCDPSTIATFGYRSSAALDKFDGVGYELLSGLPVVRKSIGALTCKVIDTMESETHTVFLGEVIDTAAFDSSENPMTYKYYHEVLKGKSPKNAPTFEGAEQPQNEAAEQTGEQAERKQTMKKWRCKLCGYIFEGEEPPEACPLCGVGPEMFELVEE